MNGLAWGGTKQREMGTVVINYHRCTSQNKVKTPT